MKFLRTTLAVALTLGAAGIASAQTATQTVNFTVTDLNTIAVSGDVTMSVAAGGSSSTDATTTYDVSTNSATAKKITAYISEVMPSGTSLSVSLANPGGGAVSAGAVALSATTALTAQDLVTNITHLAASAKQITYVLSADVNAAATSDARTVTFTIQ